MWSWRRLYSFLNIHAGGRSRSSVVFFTTTKHEGRQGFLTHQSGVLKLIAADISVEFVCSVDLFMNSVEFMCLWIAFAFILVGLCGSSVHLANSVEFVDLFASCGA